MTRKIVSLCFLILLLFGVSTAVHAFNLPDTEQTKCYQSVSPYAEIPSARTRDVEQ